MYIEASSPRVAGDNAKLELSVSGNGELSCLEFYYHMYGDSMGTLNVYSGNVVVFSTSGDHGDLWIRAEIQIYMDTIVSFHLYMYNLVLKSQPFVHFTLTHLKQRRNTICCQMIHGAVPIEVFQNELIISYLLIF